MSATCKGCGKRIIWGITPEGKKIPLDPGAAVYTISREPGPTMAFIEPLYARDSDGEKVRDHMVTHFATCSKANDFGKGRG